MLDTLCALAAVGAAGAFALGVRWLLAVEARGARRQRQIVKMLDETLEALERSTRGQA